MAAVGNRQVFHEKELIRFHADRRAPLPDRPANRQELVGHARSGTEMVAESKNDAVVQVE